MAGINTNIAALSTQSFLRANQTDVDRSSAQLASGNAIIRAADDVAALSIGTSLQTSVNALRTAQTNTAQASSLLAVADGALSNITEILQRQNALAIQATSVGAAERGFLNQEFQELTSEIDRIVEATNFNGINLLDGTLNDFVDVTTQTDINSRGFSVVADFVGASGIADGDTVVINGVTFEFDDSGASNPDGVSAGNVRIDLNITGGPADNAIALALDAAIEGEVAAGDTRLAGFTIIDSGDTGGTVDELTISYDGVTANSYLESTGLQINTSGITGITNGLNINNRADFDDVLADVTAAGGANTVGSLTGDVTQGLRAGSTTADQTTIGDSIVTTIVTTAIEQNADFTGVISGFNVSYNSANNVSISIQIGDVTYSTTDSDTSTAGALTLTGTNSNGETVGSVGFTLGSIAIEDQASANTLAERLDAAFSTVTFYQQRAIDNYSGAGDVTNSSGTVIGSLSNSVAELTLANPDVQIRDIVVTAPPTTSGNATLQIITDQGTFEEELAAGTLDVSTTNTLTFANSDDSNESFVLNFTSDGTDLDVSSESNAAAFEAALRAAFLGNGAGNAQSFQVGASASDSIEVRIQNNDATSLGIASLDISTIGGATAAATATDAAIDAISAVRANVGALQSRFDFANANLETTIQNQESAASVFLDADISAVSTEFASAQVKLSASISVLAQANQLQQNLLKLIG